MEQLCLDTPSQNTRVMPELRTYFEQIKQIPLLTAQEEQELGWAILNEGCPVARDRMVRSNLRLVVSIARNYIGRGLPTQDLIQAGNIGLLRAVSGFDPAMATRFSTYACWWIKQAIRRALLSAVQPIHVPTYMVVLLGRWKRAKENFEREFGREPTQLEVSIEMDVTLRKVQIIERASWALRAPSQASTNHEGQVIEIGDRVPDGREVPPANAIVRREQLRTVRHLLETIDVREAEILRLRFGLSGTAPSTLKQVAAEFGISRERVRQIVDEALLKLRVEVGSS